MVIAALDHNGKLVGGIWKIYNAKNKGGDVGSAGI